MNTKPLKYPLLALTIILLLSACNARRQNSLFNDPSDLIVDTITNVYVVNDQGHNDYYRIRTDDRLLIKNMQQKEFLEASTGAPSGGNAQSLPSYPVDTAGFVNIPSIGKVQVAGLNRRQVTQKLQEILGVGLNDPIIEVTIINIKVTLLGEFARQGNFLLERDNVTLIDIIGEAGGITNQADPKTLKIIRGDRAKPEIIRVNLNDINSLASKKLVLQNDDIITIMQQKSYATSNKLQSINSLVQPILVLLNVGLLILTITK